MKHDIRIAGQVFGLRPVDYDDAAFIVEVRTPERSAHMHPIERSVEAQRAFLEAYFHTPDDYYFVVERTRDRRREGLTGLLGFDAGRKSAEWGRHILRPDSLAAAESALLVFSLAFERFALEEIWGIVLASNRRMLAYAESCGLKRRRMLEMRIDGAPREACEVVLTRAQWPATRARLEELAQTVARWRHTEERATP